MLAREKRFTLAGRLHVLTSWYSRASRGGTQGSSAKTLDTVTSNTSGTIFIDYLPPGEFFGDSDGRPEACGCRFANSRGVLASIRAACYHVSKIMCHQATIECSPRYCSRKRRLFREISICQWCTDAGWNPCDGYSGNMQLLDTPFSLLYMNNIFLK